MEYFLAIPDKRIPNPLKFKAEERRFQSKEPQVINIGKAGNMVPSDLIINRFLFNSYFFLSNELQKLFKHYDESLDMVPLLITNENYSMKLIYWRLNMESTANVVTNKFLDAKNMLIDETLVKDKPIHKIHYEKQTFLLVNTYVVESVLRRYPVGIYFQEVNLAEGGS